ncbi:MAG: hypothetical protein C4291_06670 [Candidatus Dadabacteria bacterium]
MEKNISNFHKESNQALITEKIPQCPLCHKTGRILYGGLKDSVWPTPGEWAYRACTGCDVIWLDPRPIAECFNIIYPKDYVTHGEPPDFLSPRPDFWGNIRLGIKLEVLKRAYGYPVESRSFVSRFIGMLVSHIPFIKRWVGYTVCFLPARKGRLLDIGCGNGGFLLTMSKLGCWQVEGVEPDSISAELSRKSGLSIYEEPVESITLEPNSFDAITMHHVIEHLSDPMGVLKKLSSALRPGGSLVSISPNPLAFLARWFGGDWRGLDPPRHFVLMGPQALANMSSQVGLEPIVWTTARNSEWMARESISISRRGHTGDYEGRNLPWFISLGSKILTVLNNRLGEEVVLVARKR